MRACSLLYYGIMIFCLCGCKQYHHPDGHHRSYPKVYPDYADVTFPLNIAPPNFIIRETGESYQTEIGQEDGEAEILVRSNDSIVCIPKKKWKALLQKSAGKKIFFRISVLQQGKWMCYADIQDSISIHPIDPFLVYRLLYPGYELWNEMGIYQRDLTSYEEIPIAENREFEKQCINCHTFNQNSSKTMMVHVRGKQGGTLIYRGGQWEKVNPKPEGYKHGATYPAWHPSGKYIAFSANEIQQFFHSAGKKPIEVSDLAADLMIYDVENHETFTDSLVYGNQYMETFPAWTPNGNTLYFCRAKAWRKEIPLDSIRYDLYSIQFDQVRRKLHTLECVYEASSVGKSVSFPCISPDSRFLMFTQSDYGNFSIWHPESDLYLLDLASGKIRNIVEVNSDDVDSFHAWSSSGKWFVFSSKRLDGLWARLYFAGFDPEIGRFSKPFLLPQENPAFYDFFTYTYNIPALIKEPMKNDKQLVETIGQTARQAQGKGESQE